MRSRPARSFVAVLVAGLLAAAGLAGAADEPKDIIKNRKWEIQPVPYRTDGRHDPFQTQIPLKNVLREGEGRVRIVSLALSTIIVGKRKVAVFKELHGPEFSYILVNGALIGPDHKPIPGVAGTIEAINARAEYRVTLKQGGDKVEFTQPNWELAGRKAERAVPAPAGAAASRKPSEGGSSQ